MNLKLNKQNTRILCAVFTVPPSPNVRWSDIETLLRALGAEITEGAGSRVRVKLNGLRAVFHRPHPRPETDKGALVSVRRFLKEAGIEPP